MTKENLEKGHSLQFEIERVQKQIKSCEIIKGRSDYIEMGRGGDGRPLEVCYDEVIAEKVRLLLLAENLEKLKRLKAEFEAL